MRSLFRLLTTTRTAPKPAVQRDSIGFVLADGRRIDVLLTTTTALLFIVFLVALTVFPDALSPEAIIASGFLLLTYSVAATFGYQLWLERRQDMPGGR